jgi:hypothetical protein
MKHWLPNAICFQLVWLAAVGGAAQGWWWAGPIALVLFAAWQLPASRSPRSDMALMLGTAVLGFLIDSAWVWFDLMRFTTPLPWAGFAPVWIVALWMGFALTLNHSLAGLKTHLWLAGALGIVGGPLAYAVAHRAWQAVDFTQPEWIVFVALALAWGAVTPLLLVAARQLDAVSQPDAHARG